MQKKIILAGVLSLTVFLASLASNFNNPITAEEQVQGQAVISSLEPESSQDTIVSPPASQTQEQNTSSKSNTPPATTPTQSKTPPVQSSRSQGTTPKITGSAAFSTSVNNALKLLQEQAPEHARNVVTYLKEIRESDHSGVVVQTGVFHLGRNSVTGQEISWLASIMVHDAYHVQLYQQGQDYAGQKAEAQCLTVQKAVLEEVGAAESYQTYLAEILQSNYWDVPFEQRNW